MKYNDQIVAMSPMPEDGLYEEEMERLAEQARQKQERAEIRKENLSLCCNIMVFLLYLCIFSIAMLLEQSDTSSLLADHFRSLLAGGGPDHHNKMALDRIATPDDMYSFLEQVFVPALLDNNTDTNQALKSGTKLHPVDTTNRLMGSARIRQVKVKESEACEVAPMFADYKIKCYPVFNPGGILAESNEEKGNFGPEGKFSYKADDLGTGYSGTMGVYPAGGYMQYLSTNRTTAMLLIQSLRTDKFFGYATRAVFVDFTIWNSNLGAYGVMRVSVEFGPSGTVDQYLEASVLSEGSLKPGGSTQKETLAFILVLVIMAFVCYFMAEEFQEIWTSRIAYFMDGWNVLDWINMLLLIVAFIIRCMVYSDASEAAIGAAQIEFKDAYTSIRALSSKSELVRLLHSFNAVLLWGKCVKYLKHLPIVKVLVKTVWNAFSLFVPFMIMFFVVLLGFTMSYNLGFGDKLQELTTFTRAIVFLCRAFLKDIELMPVYYITPIFGAWLILLFYIVLILVSVNVLFAIMADAMFRAKCHPEDFEEDPEHHDEPLEELGRTMKDIVYEKIIHRCCPLFYKTFLKKSSAKQRLLDKQAAMAIGDAEDDAAALKDGSVSESSVTASMRSTARDTSFTYEQMMLAIQHMAGRVLSEVQEVGIEIKSELHDACERVAQMQMAVEELSWRAELVRREQETVM